MQCGGAVTDSQDNESYEKRLEAVRPRLLAFARLQLSDQYAAEDLVQDALLAAYQSLDRFRGQAKFETWVFGILRHKLLDEIRSRAKARTISLEQEDYPDIEHFFAANDMWEPTEIPQPWHDPEQALEKDHFWQVFDICVFHLPTNTARVFTLRELLGMDTDEICDSLGISEQNCWVILHRARLKLRACLEKSWFLNEEAS